jgi:hypothetical protein
MKMSRSKKRIFRKKTAALLVMRLLLSATAMAVDPNAPPPPRLSQITELRARQESEENSVQRIIAPPMVLQVQQVCTPAEQARQRIKQVGSKEEKQAGSVNVEAGHGEVKVESNEGTIENNVTVQVVNNNDRQCL